MYIIRIVALLFCVHQVNLFLQNHTPVSKYESIKKIYFQPFVDEALVENAILESEDDEKQKKKSSCKTLNQTFKVDFDTFHFSSCALTLNESHRLLLFQIDLPPPLSF